MLYYSYSSFASSLACYLLFINLYKMLKFIRTVDKSLEDFLVLDLKTLSDLADNVRPGGRGGRL